MDDVIDLSGGSRSNVPAIPDSELIQDAKDANMALTVKINDACEKECRFRSRLRTQYHTC